MLVGLCSFGRICLFKLPEATSILWLGAPSSILRASSLAPSSLSWLLPLSHRLLHSLSPLPPSCEGPCDYIWPTQIIRDPLGGLNVVTPAQPLLPCQQNIPRFGGLRCDIFGGCIIQSLTQEVGVGVTARYPPQHEMKRTLRW